MSQVQGRTYANIFGLVERYINAKILEVSRDYRFGDQVALEALVRFSDEELKHQELFRRVEALAASAMPPGYAVMADPNAVAQVVLGKSTWSVLALTCHIEIFTQVHYKKSIEPDTALSPLWKDVFLHHWQEESQHAIIDELEWRREDAKLTAAERDAARQRSHRARRRRRRHPASAGAGRRGVLHRRRRAAGSPPRRHEPSTTACSRRTAGSTSSPASRTASSSASWPA